MEAGGIEACEAFFLRPGLEDNNMSRSFWYRLLFVAVFLGAFSLVSFSQVRYVASDPAGTLLVSESLWLYGTIKLDHYGTEILSRYTRPNHHVVYEKNGHFYHYFPIGTPLLALPFVAFANSWGLSVLGNDFALQIMIASFTAVFCLYFLNKTASIFLPKMYSLGIAALFWFGTSFASTSGTALWSHNFATLCALIAIYNVLLVIRAKRKSVWPLIALSLFFAYLCRPTMALLVLCVLLSIFFYDKKVFLKISVLFLLFMGGFVLFSFYEFGQMLPDYYLPKRLSGGDFWTALYGNLFSPARGIFVYSPFIPILFLCYRDSTKEQIPRQAWYLLALAWPFLHLLTISRFPHWWAGYSFGSRLMMDALPGIFLCAVMLSPVKITRISTRLGILLVTPAALFSIYVNSYQGLFNHYTALWNGDPCVDQNPRYLFDWRYPQFLHSAQRHSWRLSEYHRILIGYEAALSDGVDFTRNGLPLFIKDLRGLSGEEPWGRWSDAYVSSSIRFEFFEPLPDRFTLELEANAFGPNIGRDLKVNIGSRTYDAHIPEGNFSVALDVDLGEEKANIIEFIPPAPTSPKELGLSEDGRKLGIGFIRMRIIERE